MQRKRGIWDGTCWRFRTRSKRSVESARYEVEGIGSVHAPDTTVQIPAVASDVLICNYEIRRGSFVATLEGFERALPNIVSLAEHLIKYGLGNRPVLLNGRKLLPNAEMLRLLHDTAGVRLFSISPGWEIDVDAIHARYGGHLCTYLDPQPHEAGIPVKNLVFTDQLHGMLAATAGATFHPAARRLSAACAKYPLLASAVEDALDRPGNEDVFERLRVYWAICR